MQLFNQYWEDTVKFVTGTMLEKYKALLTGNWRSISSSSELSSHGTVSAKRNDLQEALAAIIETASKNSLKVKLEKIICVNPFLLMLIT